MDAMYVQEVCAWLKWFGVLLLMAGLARLLLPLARPR